MSNCRWWFLLLFLGGSTLTWAESRIALQIEGLRNDEGQILVGLYDNPDPFPGKREEALQSLALRIEQGQATGAFERLPPGAYAIAVVHDENANNELDSNWLFIPTEGIGVSNNPEPRFGPPSFEEARFELGSEPMLLIIRMHYL